MKTVHGLWKLIVCLVLALASTPLCAQTVEYIHTDALGTPVAVTNSAGVVVERSEYEPYGALLNRPITDGPGFTGHVQDAATGLTYMQQRYCDPGIGRFLSVDPVTADGNTGGNFNRYKYAANNPYRFTDPDGRREREEVTGSRISGGFSGSKVSVIQIGPPSVRAGDNMSESGAPRRANPATSVTKNDYKGSPSNGEKKQVIQLVGPGDALKAKSVADKALDAASKSGLPGLHNGAADAYRHCLWSCDMSRAIGAENAKLVGDNHEAWGNNPTGETRMDLFNNRAGREYGPVPGACSDSCMQGVQDGTLMLAPEVPKP